MPKSLRIFIQILLSFLFIVVVLTQSKIYLSPYFARQGLLLAENKRLDEAVFFLNIASFLNPGDYRIHYHLGKIYTQKQFFALAWGQLKKALTLKPTFAEGYFLLGKLSYQTKQYEQALDELKQASQLEPYNQEINRLADEIKKIFVSDQVSKAAIFAGENKLTQSKKFLRKAVELTEETFVNLFVLETSPPPEKNIQEEINKLQLLSRMELEKDFQTCQLIANLYMETNDYKKGAEYYRKCLTQNPQSVSLHHNLAVALFLNGQPDKAVEEYRIALSFEPNNNSVIYGLARGYEKIGLIPEAWRLYQHLFGYSFEMPYIYIDIANLYQRQNNPIEVKKSLQEAMNLAKKRLIVNEKDRIAQLTFNISKERLIFLSDEH